MVTEIVLTTTFLRRVRIDLVKFWRAGDYTNSWWSDCSYKSGGGYGNFIEIKDEKGNVIAARTW